ncbi:MAG: hypothetical protein R3178_10280 [Rhodothermales bacterium]|nr:hypothetical protein [Rhodothermales bacterium]
MRFTLIILLTLLLHLVLGWRWDVVGGALAGWYWVEEGWWRGAAIVGLVWLGLVLYSLALASGPTLELHRILAWMAHGIPAWSVPILVVLIGALIGAIGGVIGSRARRLLLQNRSSAAGVKHSPHGDQ